MNRYSIQMPSLKPQASSLGLQPRRGTALVFVLGVLTLLALVGLVLIARTHGEFQRVTLDSTAASDRGVLDGIVRSIQDTLRQDIWGQTANPLYPLTPPTSIPKGDFREVNEAFDAPGADDRWLASLTPFNAGTSPPTGAANSFPPPIGNPMSLVSEYNVLAWPSVSYVGVDLLAPASRLPGDTAIPNIGTRPFVWAANSRVPPPTPSTPVFYNPDTNLTNVAVLQSPPPGFGGNLIAGSTTNVTIAQARETWLSQSHQTALSSLPQFGAGSPRVPQFPYFDTNADGILDLYDADGDGVPDSPLSLRIPINGGDPNAPRDLYAAVRIVDHNAMLNVNTASSLRKPSGTSSELTFDESRAGLQRRGQRSAELLLDDVVHHDDRDYESVGIDRAKGLALARSGDFPDIFDRDLIRTKLFGGKQNTGPSYFPYGLADEMALRHRGTLVPYDRRFEFNAVISDFTNVDRALRGSLQWARMTQTDGGYDPGPARWTRFNSNYGSLDYEGADLPPNGLVRGWRTMLTEDEPFAVRRHMLTTVSNDVVPMPDLIRNTNLLPDPPGFSPANPATSLDKRIYDLWQKGMDWPMLIADNSPLLGIAPPYWTNNSFSQKLVIPAAQMPPEHFRALQIDLNMGDLDSAAAKQAFIRYAAAAMYMTMENVGQYQGLRMPGPADPFVSGFEASNREYTAWQFAVNLADYRDNDNEPTAWEWPIGLAPAHYVFGVEKQPFFTEAYSYLTAGNVAGPGPAAGGPDKWWFAVELFVPPFWKLDASNLYLRIPRTAGVPTVLSVPYSFKQISTNSNLTELDGGTSGRYYVFCGATANAPLWAKGNPASYPLGSGYNDFYQIVPAPGVTDFMLPTDGTGRVELLYQSPTVPQHVIDVIGPQQSGDRLDENPSSGAGFSNGMNLWAFRPAGAMVGDKFEYNMSRCTIGWRFTTAWQHFEYGLEIIPGPGPVAGRPVPKTLGRANEAFPANPSFNRTYHLYLNIPESIWPGRALVDISGAPASQLDPAADPVTGFNAASPGQLYTPYPAFDSPADLSKLYMIGPLTNLNVAPPTFVQVYAAGAAAANDVPTTVALASMIQYGDSVSPTTPSPADQPAASDLASRIATGRVNFAPVDPAQPGKAQPAWVGRLFNFFTTQSPLFDGVDNDGNGGIDLGVGGGTSGPDPLEAWSVANRTAGRLNINTAPALVLRSVPYMSLLPTSPEFLFHNVMGGGINPLPNNYNPYSTYFSQPAPTPFWDFASAVVSRRENRSVPLRMFDPTFTPNLANGETNMRTVGVAGTQAIVGPVPAAGPPYLKGAFKAVTDLQRLFDRKDLSATNDPYVFNINRFVSDPTLRLPQHRYDTAEPILGPTNPLSPDFRFRRNGPNSGYLDYASVLAANLPTTAAESGGLRARDALLSRWAGSLTVRSDVFTAYIALIDENGNYVRRSQVTFDRTGCFKEIPAVNTANAPRTVIQPEILIRSDTNYSDDTK